MVANISPSHISYEDTLNTLKYANRAKNIRLSAKQNLIQPDTHVSEYEKAVLSLRNEVAVLKGKLAKREEAPAALPSDPSCDEMTDAGDELHLQEASEHWKVEVVRSLETRTQLQRSLIEVIRGLGQWQVERDNAKKVVAEWDLNKGPGSPMNRRAGAKLGSRSQTYEDWTDQLVQIEESIRENMETRRAIEERLEQNKMAGKELQAQLPRRVLNADLRAFLELIQRVQVLEVERLELDHQWEMQKGELEEHDSEIAMLREQLRMRNQYLRAQRALLSAEQQKKLPGRASLLGSTLAEGLPVQERGAIRIMHAWAPPPLETEDLSQWDSRPLRERVPVSSPTEESEPRDRLPPIVSGAQAGIDWRTVEVPLASQIRGIARIEPPGSLHRLAAKGWRQPPEIRSISLPQSTPNVKPPSGGPMGGRSALARGTSEQRRCNTCPPTVPDQSSLERRPSDEHDEATDLPRRMVPRPSGGVFSLRAHGVAAPLPRPVPRDFAPADKAGTPSKKRMRARSEYSGGSRMGRGGRGLVPPLLGR